MFCFSGVKMFLSFSIGSACLDTALLPGWFWTSEILPPDYSLQRTCPPLLAGTKRAVRMLARPADIPLANRAFKLLPGNLRVRADSTWEQFYRPAGNSMQPKNHFQQVVKLPDGMKTHGGCDACGSSGG